jgi:hypothetical protein
MVQLSHTVTAFGGMRRAAVISGKAAEFAHYHYLFTHLLPYDYLDLFMSGVAGGCGPAFPIFASIVLRSWGQSVENSDAGTSD